MAIDCWRCLLWSLYGYILYKIPASGGTEAGKKRKYFAAGAVGEGWRAAGDGIGQGCRRDGAGMAAGLAG